MTPRAGPRLALTFTPVYRYLRAFLAADKAHIIYLRMSRSDAKCLLVIDVSKARIQGQARQEDESQR